MVLTRKGSVRNKSYDGDSLNTASSAASHKSQGTWQTKMTKKGKKSQSGTSPVKFLDSDAPCPCMVCKELVTDEGIRCDRCNGWAHGKTHGGCCGLAPSVLDFMSSTPVEAVKWFCPPCEKDRKASVDPNDKLAEQAAKIETLVAIVQTLQQQNKLILSLLTKEQNLEEKVKVQVAEALENQKEKEERNNNLLVFNVEETSDDDKNAEVNHDKACLSDIFGTVCSDIDADSMDGCTMVRLGKRKEKTDKDPNPKARPIKVTFRDTITRNKILKRAWKLKHSEKHCKVGLAADKTLKERSEEKDLRKELAIRKQKGEDVVIFNKKVVTKAERETLKKGKAINENSLLERDEVFHPAGQDVRDASESEGRKNNE